MSDARRKLGRWGESLAATYLQSRGLEIVGGNWRCARGEIDLIVRDGEVLAFVEVKTRRGRSAGTPEEGLTPAKARKLAELGQLYLAEQDLDVDWRIDLVAVELDEGGKLLRCEHVPDVYLDWV